MSSSVIIIIECSLRKYRAPYCSRKEPWSRASRPLCVTALLLSVSVHVSCCSCSNYFSANTLDDTINQDFGNRLAHPHMSFLFFCFFGPSIGEKNNTFQISSMPCLPSFPILYTYHERFPNDCHLFTIDGCN